jgi:Mlc titration factor MtfA (ptsG expression regulator)
MFEAFKAWRRRRVLEHHAVPDEMWGQVVAQLPFLLGLTAEEMQRLRERVVLFLHDKQINGAGGLLLTDAMRLTIAVQACLLSLNLDPDCYDGWVEIIVYPDEFVPEYEYEDEHGLVHTVREARSGEAWEGGPLILSWVDAAGDHGVAGYNVVIHEFAHKLDMLNGEANGFPRLHADMSRQAWGDAFSAAYEDFCARVDAGDETELDPYASESPAEFFAVLSEAFFVAPQSLRAHYPAVYEQLRLFYRQNPALREYNDGAATGFSQARHFAAE